MCSPPAAGFGDELLGVLSGDRRVLEPPEDFPTYRDIGWVSDINWCC
jgi:hypothetical protein